ncbi:hypothetical protein RJ639_031734 [Escallonia herrerae]|uniref:Uncharacterized protein n=1 Tax=Escallonia herrerae TaxID=1293975 RepID=A0AA88WXZ5_9ASTE|nr:hypothetical protein RJ639_031734 [Escallonia herrerae]
MGGKGRKRREKNFRAAHGGHNPLPPPPAASSLDAVPSKLRKLMAFSSTTHHQQQLHQGSGKGTVDGAHRRKKEGIEKDASKSSTIGVNREHKGGREQHMDHDDGTLEKKKKKRKRKPVEDLRFDAAGELAVASKRKERKKMQENGSWFARLSHVGYEKVKKISAHKVRPWKPHLDAAKRILKYLNHMLTYALPYKKDMSFTLSGLTDADWAGNPMLRHSTSGFSAGCAAISRVRFSDDLSFIEMPPYPVSHAEMKHWKFTILLSKIRRLQAMKKKHKKVEANDLPAVDVIKFGEVVEAPPKLITVPKAFKSAQNASKERLRLQAVENYRNRRGWTSRPGIQLPPPMAT